MQLDQVLTVFAIVAANLGTVLSLYMNMDKKLEANRKETNDILEAIRQDMKDFHGRLCAIEERGKK
jgi:hypothetical protein